MAIAFILGYLLCLAVSATTVSDAHLVARFHRGDTPQQRERVLERNERHLAYVAHYGHGKPRRTHARALRWVKHELLFTRLQFADQDFQEALRFASDVYDVDYGWLHACAAAEGGFRGFIMNRQGSGAGGWMQFFPSTLYDNIDAAFSFAASQGVVGLGRYRSWTSRVGQAFTAAHMFRQGDSGQWTGAGC